MGDAGEGLIDAEDRFQQWVAEREQQKQRKGVASADPERDRKLNTLRLAKAEMERQQAVTTSEIRREQIRQALVEIERQLEDDVGALSASTSGRRRRALPGRPCPRPGPGSRPRPTTRRD